MKKFLFVLFGVFVFSGAFAAGENIPTSKSYVDAAVAQKQDKISASIIVPAGYTQLEYIESTGTQWIDTQQKFMYGDEFYFEYMPMASYSAENKGYGAGANLGVNITGGGRNSNSRVCMYGFGGNLCYEPQLLYDYTLGRRYIENWTLKSGVFYSVLTDVNDGSTYTTSKGSISQSYDSGDTVYLWRDHSPTYSFPSKSRIYRTWLKRADGTMAFDLFPARRDSDNVVGMYDTISGRFFTNSGTGEFIAGPVIIPDIQVLTNTGTVGEYGTKGIYDATGEYATQQNNLVDAVTMNTAVQNAIDSEFQCIEWLDPNDHSSDCLLMDVFGTTVNGGTTLPNGYTVLEYLASTGTQYIDTGRKFMHGDEFYFEYMPMASYSSENKGYGAGANTGINITGGGRNNGSRVCMYEFGGNLCYEPQLLYNYTLGRRYIENWTLKSGVFHSVLTDVNDGSTYTISRGSISQSYNSGDSVYLWRDHSPTYSYPSKSRIYRTWLKRADGTMAFDLFPARRNSDNVVGMYDTVTGQFFTNSGTDEFIAGPVANMYLPAGN